MSHTMEAQIRHLQKRLAETEAALAASESERDAMREALRPFAEANRWDTPAINVSRKHFARAAELVPDTSQG